MPRVSMYKIASPKDLQAELRSIMAFIHAHGPEGKPDRNVLAAKLRDLADRVASKLPSVGQKDKIEEDTYKVKRVFPTVEDADGPLPKDLLRLIKKGGGAALVELIPPKDYKVQGDMIVGPDSSRPRYYIRAFGPSGSWDGHPVHLKPAQLKRLNSY